MQQIFPTISFQNFWKICNCLYENTTRKEKELIKNLLLHKVYKYYFKMGFYSCLKMSIFKIDFPFSNQIFFINRLIADIFLYSGCDGKYCSIFFVEVWHEIIYVVKIFPNGPSFSNGNFFTSRYQPAERKSFPLKGLRFLVGKSFLHMG